MERIGEVYLEMSTRCLWDAFRQGDAGAARALVDRLGTPWGMSDGQPPAVAWVEALAACPALFVCGISTGKE